MSLTAERRPETVGPAADAIDPSLADWALSPSRAMDFKTCALLYRFRVIDRLPEPPSIDAARGTVIHSVLEQLFDLPPSQRTLGAATSMVAPAWQLLLENDPDLADLVGGEDQLTEIVTGTVDLIGRYFDLEDPTRLEP